MKLIFKILIASCLFSACTKFKNTPDDLGGQGYIHGRVITVDTLYNDWLPSYLPNGKVYVSHDGGSDSTLNYIYAMTGDANGYFSFNNLPNGNYVVFGDTTISGVVYHGQQEVLLKQSSDSVPLYLFPSQDKQNGIVYIVENGADSGALSGASVCMFNSPAIAALDTCAGSNYSAISNGAGHAVLLNLQPQQIYYTLVQYRLGNLLLEGRDTVTMNGINILKKNIYLR